MAPNVKLSVSYLGKYPIRALSNLSIGYLVMICTMHHVIPEVNIDLHFISSLKRYFLIFKY